MGGRRNCLERSAELACLAGNTRGRTRRLVRAIRYCRRGARRRWTATIVSAGPTKLCLELKSGIGRENHKMMLDHYQQTKNLLVSYSPDKLGFF